jgi:phosphoserine phosphatase
MKNIAEIMKSKPSAIAVYDWDNTVRANYTIEDWLDFLLTPQVELTSEQKFVISSIKETFNAYAGQCSQNIITHDEFAIGFNAAYCFSLKGWSASLLATLADSYIKLYKNKVFGFAKESFEYFYRMNVPIYIVTGAPYFIVEKCKKEFSINDIYGFTPDVKGDKLSGCFLVNYGHSERKREAIEKIKAIYNNERIVFGFGDSESDIPILNESDVRFVVGKKELDIPNLIRICPNESWAEIIQKRLSIH